jgi:hypothetical protein
MRWGIAAVCVGAVLAGCGKEGLPNPAQTDEALVEGRVLALPVEGAWPRLGIQWTYRVTASGFPAGEKFPPRIAYRLTTTDDMGHPWSGWWMYGKGRGMATTGAKIRDDYVFFHPPRLDEFGQLEYAPWPTADVGRPGMTKETLTLGKGYGSAEGKTVETTRRDLDWEKATVPAGSFERAWHVDGSTAAFQKGPSWKGDFWWVPRVGWTTMRWEGGDGRRLELTLEAVRDVAPPK